MSEPDSRADRRCPACANGTEHTTHDVAEGFRDHPWPFIEAYVAWLREHGIDDLSTYRTEHHLIDAPLIRVFGYAKDDQGRCYLDESTGDAAIREPLDVLCLTPPPRPEDYS